MRHETNVSRFVLHRLGMAGMPVVPTLARVPVLKWSDPLPGTPKRVLVAGAVTAGKSTLARQIGASWELPYVEMDGLCHG